MELRFRRKREFNRMKEIFEKAGIDSPVFNDEEEVMGLVNWLIISLYEPDEENVYRVNEEKIRKYGLDRDAINWGDLKCYAVEKIAEDKYVVYVDEAAPDATSLQKFIEEWMKKWGWDVEVHTEW